MPHFLALDIYILGPSISDVSFEGLVKMGYWGEVQGLTRAIVGCEGVSKTLKFRCHHLWIVPQGKSPMLTFTYALTYISFVLLIGCKHVFCYCIIFYLHSFRFSIAQISVVLSNTYSETYDKVTSEQFYSKHYQKLSNKNSWPCNLENFSFENQLKSFILIYHLVS